MSTGAGPEPSRERSAEEPRTGTGPDDAAPLTGARVRGLFAAASGWLDRNAPAINAINVFPVPDGDTGSNMAATLRATLASAGAGLQTAGEVTALIARNALMSARGNSGVILSQILRGFAEATSGIERIDGHALAQALTAGSRAAYAALENPIEGTILTVVKAAAEAAEKARSANPRAVLEAALAGARTALAHTPDHLPLLKQAGVVDSGGYGLVVLLEGAVQFLRGETQPEAAHPVEAPRADWLADTHSGPEHELTFGYCTQFMLRAGGATVEAVRARFAGLGDSLLVVGESQGMRLHLHTRDPGAALSLGTALGPLTSIKIDNMQAQFDLFAAHAGDTFTDTALDEPASAPMPPAATPLAGVSTVAVASGAGLVELMHGYGATVMIEGGQTMNPSVEQILHAIERTPSASVIVLPNNRNVVLSAEQAAQLSTRRVGVIRTTSAPQGISALLAFNTDASMAENVAAMERARSAVRTIEVTRAARAARLNDIEIQVGEPIGLIDGVLRATGASPESALLAALEFLAPAHGVAIALYYGGDTTAERVRSAESLLNARFPELDIEVLAGGQPLYDYILSVE